MIRDGSKACILVIDKEGADNRSGIFMIDAGKGYVKDGNKNRLREQDIYRIVTTFNQQIETDPNYARFVPNKEIKEKNDYNLNISRYIDSSEPEDVQDIYAHIHGGIPEADIDSLWRFWEVFPKLKGSLLGAFRDGYYKLIVEEDQIRPTIFSDREFIAYGVKMDEAYLRWKTYADQELKTLKPGVSGKKLIERLAQVILDEFEGLVLIDKYSVYQVLLTYWNDVLGDDVSLIISEDAGYGVARETENITKETKKKDADGNPERKVVGWEGKLIPKDLVISELFPEEKRAIEELTELAAETDSRLAEMIAESEADSILTDMSDGGRVKSKDIRDKMTEIKKSVHTPLIDALVEFQKVFPEIKRKADYMDYIGEHILCEVAYADNGTVTRTSIAYALESARLEAPVPEAYEDDYKELEAALRLAKRLEDMTKTIKALEKELDTKARERYAALTDDEIMDLLVNRKWYYAIGNGINDLYRTVSHQLADRIMELSRRYENTLPDLLEQVSTCESKVKQHLERMGFTW